MLRHARTSEVYSRMFERNQHVRHFCRSLVARKMKAWCSEDYGVNNKLFIDDVEVPRTLKANEVLVEVKAASLNPFDSLMRKGFGSRVLDGFRRYKKVHELPIILGRDFSGVVVKTGKMVTRVKEEDEVWGTPAFWRPGTFAQYCCVGQDELSLKPKSLSDVEAASFPYAHCTAWSALCDTGGLTQDNARDKRVFIVGGSGGVGSIAIQLMKAWGANVTSTCSKDAIKLLEKIGTDDIIDYNNEDVAKRIKDKPRYDLILDTVGGNLGLFSGNQSRHSSAYILLTPPILDNIEKSGFLLGILRSSGEFLSLSVSQRLLSNMKYQWAYFKPNAQALNHLNKIISEGKAIPVIDSVFNFSELPSAFERLNSGHLRGKVVVDFQT